MHMADASRHVVGTNGIVGGGIPHAVGLAVAARTLGTGACAVAFFGDGAANQGTFHESLNLAAVWGAPVVFVCENNGYGEFSASDSVTAGPGIAAPRRRLRHPRPRRRRQRRAGRARGDGRGAGPGARGRRPDAARVPLHPPPRPPRGRGDVRARLPGRPVRPRGRPHRPPGGAHPGRRGAARRGSRPSAGRSSTRRWSAPAPRRSPTWPAPTRTCSMASVESRPSAGAAADAGDGRRDRAGDARRPARRAVGRGRVDRRDGPDPRPGRRVRPGAGARHADLRAGLRRRGGRRGDGRAAARRRPDVRVVRLRLPRPGRQPGGPHPLDERRAVPGAADARGVGRRGGRQRGPPLGDAAPDLHGRRRPQRRLPVDGARRLLADARGDRLRRPDHRPLPPRPGRRARHGRRGAAGRSARRWSTAPATTSRSSPAAA